MKDLALQLKRNFEKEHYQVLHSARCKCGKFTKIIMSSYVSGNTLYAILYCSRCNKFYFHSGGSCLEICGETTYHGSSVPIEYESQKWKEIINQIEKEDIFAKI